MKPELRRGVIPRICGALISARKAARTALSAPGKTPAERAVLDGRQKALKLCSNALYGFTGATSSPQQAVPLADTCLSLGAALCRHVLAMIERGLGGRCRVIYGQTDSLFLSFPGATRQEAVEMGQVAAELATKALPEPLTLNFERVLAPFLLLQVNRYAGQEGGGYPGGYPGEAVCEGHRGGEAGCSPLCAPHG